MNKETAKIDIATERDRGDGKLRSLRPIAEKLVKSAASIVLGTVLVCGVPTKTSADSIRIKPGPNTQIRIDSAHWDHRPYTHTHVEKIPPGGGKPIPKATVPNAVFYGVSGAVGGYETGRTFGSTVAGAACGAAAGEVAATLVTTGCSALTRAVPVCVGAGAVVGNYVGYHAGKFCGNTKNFQMAPNPSDLCIPGPSAGKCTNKNFRVPTKR